MFFFGRVFLYSKIKPDQIFQLDVQVLEEHSMFKRYIMLIISILSSTAITETAEIKTIHLGPVKETDYYLAHYSTFKLEINGTDLQKNVQDRYNISIGDLQITQAKKFICNQVKSSYDNSYDHISRVKFQRHKAAYGVYDYKTTATLAELAFEILGCKPKTSIYRNIYNLLDVKVINSLVTECRELTKRNGNRKGQFILLKYLYNKAPQKHQKRIRDTVYNTMLYDSPIWHLPIWHTESLENWKKTPEYQFFDALYKPEHKSIFYCWKIYLKEIRNADTQDANSQQSPAKESIVKNKKDIHSIHDMWRVAQVIAKFNGNNGKNRILINFFHKNPTYPDQDPRQDSISSNTSIEYIHLPQAIKILERYKEFAIAIGLEEVEKSWLLKNNPYISALQPRDIQVLQDISVRNFLPKGLNFEGCTIARIPFEALQQCASPIAINLQNNPTLNKAYFEIHHMRKCKATDPKEPDLCSYDNYSMVRIPHTYGAWRCIAYLNPWSSIKPTFVLEKKYISNARHDLEGGILHLIGTAVLGFVASFLPRYSVALHLISTVSLAVRGSWVLTWLTKLYNFQSTDIYFT